MFVVRSVVASLLVLMLKAAVHEVNDCEWRMTRNNTVEFEVPEDKQDLYLVAIPQTDNTEVNITIVTDGKEQESKNPMYAIAGKAYKTPFVLRGGQEQEGRRRGTVVTVGSYNASQWYFCFTDLSPTACPWPMGSYDVVSTTVVSTASPSEHETTPSQDSLPRTNVPDSLVAVEERQTGRSGGMTLQPALVMLVMWLVLHNRIC
ncbi:hypothetical protein GWK47_044251 [Chionoecetes opilio]|uniref:Uncharacterized protein n=1 Tax=Chionoecetes opilio TaxID=41210 RepID=A0A8J4Y8I9_CHIOP|nr:hypothetical protein GWK47_044251 [Chionoecetes opilio]